MICECGPSDFNKGMAKGFTRNNGETRVSDNSTLPLRVYKISRSFYLRSTRICATNDRQLSIEQVLHHIAIKVENWAHLGCVMSFLLLFQSAIIHRGFIYLLDMETANKKAPLRNIPSRNVEE